MAYDEKIKKMIRKSYQNGVSFEEISKQFKIGVSTVKRWAYKDKWISKNDTKKRLKQNKKRIKHGLFAKYLPEETLELAGLIKKMSLLDILWENICLKYAAIIRSQQIMYVKDSNDVTKRITVDGSETTVYQYTEAYEKQASFLIAQSRAMRTLISLIKQYEEMCNSELATEEQKLRIEKLKTEITKTADEDPVKVEIIDDVPKIEVKTNADEFE